MRSFNRSILFQIVILFVLTACGGSGGSSDSNPPTQNNSPEAFDDVLNTNEDTAVSGQLIASDLDGDQLTYSTVNQPSFGIVSLNSATGTYNYIPNLNANGNDSFTFRANDGNAFSGLATVSVIIDPVNDPPIANVTTLTTNEDTAVSGQLIASDLDGDQLIYTIVTQPSLGNISLNSATGAFTYTPNSNATGIDSFTFQVNDGLAGSGIVTVTIMIAVVNEPPIASNGVLITDEDVTAFGQLTASDADGDQLTYSIVTQPGLGLISLNTATGEYTYVPSLNVNGNDSFSFRVNDGFEDSNFGVVNITIPAVNDAPVTNSSSLTVTENTAGQGQLNAADVDGDLLTYSIETQPSIGTVSLNNTTGAYTYTPNTNVYGNDNFTFRATDGSLNSNIASANVSIIGIEKEPNNTSLEASELLFDSTITGQIANSADEDWFSFGAVGGTNYRVIFAGSAGNAFLTWNIQVFDGSDNLLAATSVTSSSTQTNYANLDVGISISGTYYVVVDGSTSLTQPYTLTVTTSPVSNLEIEPNNSSVTAIPLALDNQITGQIANSADEDWFSFGAVGGTNYRVIFAGSAGNAFRTWNIQVFDGSDNLLAATSVTSSSTQTNYANLDVGISISGTYYVVVDGSTSLLTQPYTLTVTTSPVSNLEIEPNNSSVTAIPLALDNQITGQIANSADEDWFSFGAVGGTNYRVIFAGSAGNAFLTWNIQVFDGSDNLLAATSVTSSSTQTNYANLDVGISISGTYYVVVDGSTSLTQPYTLTVTTSPVSNLEIEPNNSSVTATPLALDNQITGQIANSADEDWFSFGAVGGTNYRVIFAGSAGNAFRTWNIQVFDGSDNLLAATSVTSSSTQTNYANLDVGISISGTYYVVVDGSTSLLTQPYILTVATGLPVISGNITASQTNFVDSDTNNPIAFYAPNNTPNNAQPIPNVATIGGYVTEGPTGISGDVFEFSTDPIDSFRVILSANQDITLTINDFGLGVDLDLYLYSTSDVNIPVASSAGTGSTEFINVPTDDEYFVVIEAFSGASKYILNVGQLNAAIEPSQILRLEDQFVLGQVVAKAQTAQARGFPPISNQSVATRHGLNRISGDIGRAALFEVDQNVSLTNANKPSGDCCGALNGQYGYDIDEVLHEAYRTIKAVKDLRKDDDIKYAEPNYILTAEAVPNDEYYELQWHYPLINLPQAWDYTTGDSSIVTAVIDTGVFLSHPDLVSNVIPGYDFISNVLNSNDGNGIDDNSDDPGDSLIPGYSSFHGTHVAGTVAAVSNNSSGVSGVAHNVKIMPIRVLGLNGGTAYDITQGILYAAGLTNDSGTIPQQSADVINLSLGGPGFSGTQQDAISDARNSGAIIVAAAGNNSSDQLFYPASYDGVISVSAVGFNKTLTPYSNYGSSIDVTAPGGDMSVDLNADGYSDGVLSTAADDSNNNREPVYQFKQGTSMASPHVAGVVALMKSVYPTLTPDDVDSLITTGLITEDISGDGALNRNDNYGYGLIDALKAVQQATALATGNPTPTVLTVSPAIGSIQSSQTYIDFTIGKTGDASISILSFSTDTIWATLTPLNINQDGLGEYRLSVDTTGLNNGVYTIIANFDSDTNSTISAVIKVIVNSLNLSPDAGHIYVLLIDPITGNTVYFTDLAATNGEYSYAIQDVSPGEYYILAGSDNDNNLIICEDGESCGGYPTRGDIIIFSVNQDITNLDFNISFDQNLGATQLFNQGVEVISLPNAVQ